MLSTSANRSRSVSWEAARAFFCTCICGRVNTIEQQLRLLRSLRLLEAAMSSSKLRDDAGTSQLSLDDTFELLFVSCGMGTNDSPGLFHGMPVNFSVRSRFRKSFDWCTPRRVRRAVFSPKTSSRPPICTCSFGTDEDSEPGDSCSADVQGSTSSSPRCQPELRCRIDTTHPPPRRGVFKIGFQALPFGFQRLASHLFRITLDGERSTWCVCSADMDASVNGRCVDFKSSAAVQTNLSA
mmetsp:Transcript_44493/g.110749  ORF Transcript_44493/g.110749 Transcript_44493/m.110749 type:complete len:239 (+) Transcript_44493:161-877(+)